MSKLARVTIDMVERSNWGGSNQMGIALMVLGATMILLAIMVHLVTMMRFDRLAREDDIGPDPDGYDPELETRREFHSRTRIGIAYGFMGFGAISIVLSLVSLMTGINDL